jgi:hypothetical protein
MKELATASPRSCPGHVRRRPPALLLALAATTACAGDSATPSAVTRDSAGIVIVENTTRQLDADRAWRVDPEPVVQIGMIDGPAEYLLASVSGAVRLADGRIAIGDAGAGSIRVYDARGRHLRSFGRPGQGPGEFRSLSLHAMPGDTLLILDVTNRRLSVLDATTGFVRFMPLPPDVPALDVHGVLGDGTILAWQLRPPEPKPATIAWDSLVLLRVRLADAAAEPIARLPSRQRDAAPGLERVSVVAPAGHGFWFGTAGTFEIGYHDLAGRLTRIARLEHTAPPDTPSYVGALADPAGNAWIWSFGENWSPDWFVFSPAGELLAKVTMPAGFQPWEIGDDYVLARHWDEYQVEYVRLYRLVKP